MIQKRAERLICGAMSSEHITPYLTRLHWLPVNQLIKLKLFVFVYLCVTGSSPSYLISDVVPSSTYNTHYLSLWSFSDRIRLHVPKTTLSSGDSGFCVAGPRLWNSLPRSIREALSLVVFKKCLKTYLFA
ncbi:hypothetical protein HOLleu_40164 [Holothuria leucospilota]|uniref:Uncharacterized protein n=1 Tax=Holothuria leucospilota TaxID=206669 RepID=A0A9Q0YHW4_HOLLE|nr:hypothetical protein HOLleu_40164 [Holothuria leucospilota]